MVEHVERKNNNDIVKKIDEIIVAENRGRGRLKKNGKGY